MPTDLVQRADDPALYVTSQVGHVVRLLDGRSVPMLDISDRTTGWSEQGLLGLVFSPAGDRAYLSYTATSGGALNVIEVPFTAEGRFDLDASRVLLTIDQPTRFHKGGDLVIGPDGLLYISTGDGSDGADRDRVALALDSLLGKILRIDPTPSADLPYTIPPDNPYYGVDGVRQEIWASGLRNPWKFAFDSVTDDLWIADVGEAVVEEVNRVPAPGNGDVAGRGASFGWSAYEGDERLHVDQPADGHISPVLVYRHGEDGCAVTGGATYRGSAIPGLDSAFVYSDFCSGKVWALYPDSGENVLLAETQGTAGVMAGNDGELYVLHVSGLVSRIDPA